MRAQSACGYVVPDGRAARRWQNRAGKKAGHPTSGAAPHAGRVDDPAVRRARGRRPARRAGGAAHLDCAGDAASRHQRGTGLGLWSRDERSALRWLARSTGASCRTVYLPVDRRTQLARILDRQAARPDQTFPMSEADVDQWRQMFQVPDVTELDDAELAGPPAARRAGRRGPRIAGHRSPTAEPYAGTSPVPSGSSVRAA
jgi:hypothetical protein